MAKDPSMPFYVNDWLSSTTVTCMSLAEQGAYVRLLCHCWASQDASIPDNDRALAALSGLGPQWDAGSGEVIRQCFEPHPTNKGFLTNRRVCDLWQERQDWRAKCSVGGQKSAKTRKGSAKGSSTTLGRVVPRPLEVNGQVTAQVNGNSSSSSSSSINPPPPESDWREVEEELSSHGIGGAPQIVAAAPSLGWTPELAIALVNHWQNHRESGGWGAPLLASMFQSPPRPPGVCLAVRTTVIRTDPLAEEAARQREREQRRPELMRRFAADLDAMTSQQRLELLSDQQPSIQNLARVAEPKWKSSKQTADLMLAAMQRNTS